MSFHPPEVSSLTEKTARAAIPQSVNTRMELKDHLNILDVLLSNNTAHQWFPHNSMSYLENQGQPDKGDDFGRLDWSLRYSTFFIFQTPVTIEGHTEHGIYVHRQKDEYTRFITVITRTHDDGGLTVDPIDRSTCLATSHVTDNRDYDPMFQQEWTGEEPLPLSYYARTTRKHKANLAIA